MKNKSLIFITVLFGLLLVGIIIIQFRWAGQIAKMNAKAFDDAVYKSLSAVVRQVEEKENYVFIKRQVETDDQLKKTKKFLKDHAMVAKRHHMKTSSAPENVSIHVSSDNGKETKTVVRIEKDNKGHKYIYNSVYVGAATIDSLPGEKAILVTPPVPPTPPIMETIEGIDDKKESVEIILEKMLNLRDPDSVTISPKDIEKMIATQLKQNDLPETFQLVLLSKDPEKSYVGSLPNNTDRMFTPYRVNLYPNDIFGREVTLVLMLPTSKTNYVDAGLGAPMILSLFFTAAIFTLFVYSLRMLVRHKKMLEMKNDFINHMSHEFKTPLAGISLGADILMSKQGQMDSEQINKVAGSIKKQSLRLSQEVNDVLQNALMEENINKPHTLFNVIDTLKNQIEMLQPQIEDKRAKVNTNFASDKILIHGDEAQWQKVFSNLIDNSLKFSRENPELNISVVTGGNKVKMEFVDNGVGIASKDLPHIFDKFFRSDYYKQSNIKGFGLGLSLVKTVVDSHKGTIKAESELNSGTKITIEINAEN